MKNKNKNPGEKEELDTQGYHVIKFKCPVFIRQTKKLYAIYRKLDANIMA